MLTKFGRRMDGHTGNFIKQIENIRKCQKEVTDLKHTITAMKNILVEFNSILDEAEERLSELKKRAVELTYSISKEENQLKKVKTAE